jgi:capsular exopolysaccharide synthesis family protein
MTGRHLRVSDALPDPGIDAIDPRLVLKKLLRKKWFILATWAILSVLFAAVVLAVPAWYTAEAEIVIDQRPQGADLAAVLSRLPTDPQAVQTEAEALRSRSLAEKTIAQLDLLADPEFNRSIIPLGNSLGSRLRRLMRSLSSFIPALTGPSHMDPALEARSEAVKIFLKHLYVSPLGRSQVLKATFTSESPELASKILNTLISLYLGAQIEHRLAAPETLVEFMRGELDRLQERVRAANEAVERYRNDYNLQQGIVQGREAPLAVQELSDANDELIKARARRQEAQARVDAIRANPDAVTDVLASNGIQQLRLQISAMQETRSQLLATYGPSYPKLQQVQASIADAQGRMKAEIGKFSRAAASDLAVATEQEQQLAETVASLKQRIRDSGGSRVTLAQLEQEAEVSRSILTSFLTQYSQMVSQRSLQVADSYVLSGAVIPTEKTFPKAVPFILLGAAGAFMLSCGCAMLLGRRDETIRSPSEIQPLLTARLLGVIPQLPPGRSVLDEVVTEAQSIYTEAIRGILSSLRLGAEHGHVTLVTSAESAEGKTSVAIALSRLAALSGSHVMLIGCDLRRPALQSAFQDYAGPGLTELLQGGCHLAAASRTDPASGLAYIHSGQIRPQSANLLSVAAMRALIAEARQRYDLVFLDSPPAALVSDARILAQFADETVLVVSWNRTPWRLARDVIDLLHGDKRGLPGVVLNNVDPRRYQQRYYAPAEPVLVLGATAPAG